MRLTLWQGCRSQSPPRLHQHPRAAPWPDSRWLQLIAPDQCRSSAAAPVRGQLAQGQRVQPLSQGKEMGRSADQHAAGHAARRKPTGHLPQPEFIPGAGEFAPHRTHQGRAVQVGPLPIPINQQSRPLSPQSSFGLRLSCLPAWPNQGSSRHTRPLRSSTESHSPALLASDPPCPWALADLQAPNPVGRLRAFLGPNS